MASSFCMNCGKPLAAGSAFCMSCGAPVSGAAAPSAPAGASTAPASPPPGFAPTPTPVAGVPAPMGSPPAADAGGPSLGALLGLEGKRQFVVKHEMLSMGHSYRVMDHEKRHLFEVKGNVAQEMKSNFLGNIAGSFGERSGNMTYSLVNSQGAVVGTFNKQGGPNESVFTLIDVQGRPWVTVSLARGGFGGITATAVSPDGRPMMETKGNLMKHDFKIHDPSGAELAKVHEAWASVRDTYNIDLLGNIDPLYPLAFAILIDYEKVK
jgi:uncharacterized protein YxjI